MEGTRPLDAAQRASAPAFGRVVAFDSALLLSSRRSRVAGFHGNRFGLRLHSTSQSKEKIQKAYNELGKKIYENRTNGNTSSEEEIQAVCDNITTLFKEIQKAEAEILKLKDIKTCEKCSAEIDVNATFCPKCGAEQPKEEIVNVEIKTEPEDAKEVEIIEVHEENVTTENNEEESKENKE